MATFIIDSKASLEKRDQIQAAIDNGRLPHPPIGTQKLNTCELLGCETVLRRHVKGHGQCCLDCAWAMDEWQSVLDLVEKLPDPANKIPDWLHPCWVCGKYCMDIPSARNILGVLVCDECRSGHVGYDDTCGMKPDAHFTVDILVEWAILEAEIVANLDTLTWGEVKVTYEKELGKDFKCGLEYIVDKYLASHRWPRLLAKGNLQHVVIADDMWGWFVMEAYDRFARWRHSGKYSQVLANRGSDLLPPKKIDPYDPFPTPPEIIPRPDSLYVQRLNELGDASRMASRPSPEPASEAQPATPVVLPQTLQSKEDILEAIAMSKAPVPPEKIDELVEAVKFSIANRNNAEARILPGGYYLRAQPPNAPVPTYIFLCHPDHPNRVVVGELSIMSDKDTHSELEFVSSRGEIREFMHKVAAGMQPSTSGKLPGVMMPVPIPEDAKQVSRMAGSNEFADVAKIEDLPMFAPDDPESAA